MNKNIAMLRTMSLLLAYFFLLGCAPQHTSSQTRNQLKPQTLGYLQFKDLYADTAWVEGKLDALQRVFQHRHSQTGKPYPCWNALRSFRGQDLPVSLKIEEQANQNILSFLELAGLPPEKFDELGKDGTLFTTKPKPKAGTRIWQIQQRWVPLPVGLFPKPVTGLVDISGSMAAKKKLKTIQALKDSKVQFKQLYSFSGPNTLRKINLTELTTLTPQGRTALYDSLARILHEHPQEEILVITDGRDNESQTEFETLLDGIEKQGNKVGVVLTGRNAKEDFAKVSQINGGSSLEDIQESGEILKPTLEVVQE